MPDIIHLGGVGLRNIGKGHIRRCAELTDARVVAMADTDPARLAAAVEEFEGPRAYPDAEELFEQDDVDAVVLAVPNQVHACLAVQALEAGKHVLVEKPMARTTAEAEEMLHVRDATDRILMMGMNQRFSPLNAA